MDSSLGAAAIRQMFFDFFKEVFFGCVISLIGAYDKLHVIGSRSIKVMVFLRFLRISLFFRYAKIQVLLICFILDIQIRPYKKLAKNHIKNNILHKLNVLI